jgi:preprotein translocase subunit SecG
MDFLYSLVLTVHILVGLGVIGLVLIQHGKGADMGAAFGSGASGSLFGASGSANFMSRTTGILATLFFVTSLSLSYLATTRTATSGSVMDNMPTQNAPVNSVPAPVAPSENSPAKDIPK